MNQFESLIQPDAFHWEQLEKQLVTAGISLPDGFFEQMQKLALGSNYATAQLVKHPDITQSLANCTQFKLEAEQLISSLESQTDLIIIKKQLRYFRHLKICQIIYLDICRQQPVANTLHQLSELADLLIQQALLKAQQILSTKHGQPVHQNGEPMQLNIIGMGKLGGRELNFSSDIDLICVFSEEGQLKGYGMQSYSQHFTNVIKLLKQFLNDSTEDGFVYRVDLRLRPWGDSGPVALSHAAFEHYYQLHGREWEQYAMIKARVITGSDSEISSIQSIIKPFVYRRYHDYRVFDGLANLKYKIDVQAKRKSARRNVKIGQGGIREIEFYVQAFQILKGGRNQQLQTQSLYRALEILSEQHITDQHTLQLVHQSYNFLRMLENRIQMMNDQQTHEIPDKENFRDRISLLMGYENWGELDLKLTEVQSQVHDLFSTLFVADDEQPGASAELLSLDDCPEQQHKSFIESLNFNEPEKIHHRLMEFYQSRAMNFMSDKAKKRFREFFPELLKQVALHDDQYPLLEKMIGLLSSIAGRSVYFELLYQNIPLLVKLVDLFHSSQFIADEVSRHPLLLESLLYPGHLDDRFNIESLKQELDIQLRNVAGDIELELDVLRQFKRAQTIVIATAEIAEEIDTIQVSHYLSDLAEIILQAVYELSRKEINALYGEPGCIIDGKTMTPHLGIIAYGKLGGFELHYQSDLDIIFLHNSSGSQQQTVGPKVIDNPVYFSRLAQKIISKITLLTAAGKLYEIDTRLRPDGASGMLVSALAAYRKYQHEKAWVWEHQAIIRARFIAGNRDINPEFSSVRNEIITLPRDNAELKAAIIDMRQKMYLAKNPRENESINLKHSRGCMVDIEFLVQYRVLQHANKFASLSESTDNIGLINGLFQLNLIDEEELKLIDIYQKFHRLLHHRVLQNLSEEIASISIQAEITQVKACWDKTFNEC